jgi:hypothetical protein
LGALIALPPQVLGLLQVGPEEAVAEATAEEEVLEDLIEAELELETGVALDKTEETALVADEVELVVSITLGGRVVLVASYPLEAVTTTSKSSRQPPWLVAVEASRLEPQRVHL